MTTEAGIGTVVSGQWPVVSRQSVKLLTTDRRPLTTVSGFDQAEVSIGAIVKHADSISFSVAEDYELIG